MPQKNTALVQHATHQTKALSQITEFPIAIRLQVGMTAEEVLRVGEVLAQLDKRNQFYIGDYLADVESIYGSMYEQAISLFQRDYYRLAQYKSTAKRFPMEQRQKFEQLSYSHFEAVAPLENNLAELLLGKAIKSGWSVDRLRRFKKRFMDRYFPMYDQPQPTPRIALRAKGAVKDIKIQQSAYTNTVSHLQEMRLKPILDKALKGELKPGDRVQVVVEVYMIEMEEDLTTVESSL